MYRFGWMGHSVNKLGMLELEFLEFLLGFPDEGRLAGEEEVDLQRRIDQSNSQVLDLRELRVEGLGLPLRVCDSLFQGRSSRRSRLRRY